ncbi:uncharacterized protein SPSC_03541 [Sporisorium scitamineum]|uniref:Effector family protein Eff1 n=1 Tax=Sporisorium scitamineum TaxID=49012 RepID=A0A140KN50_9BASI|nr:uncharacterized protein SPSC_03541 [Sporisorium scitamineum]
MALLIFTLCILWFHPLRVLGTAPVIRPIVEVVTAVDALLEHEPSTELILGQNYATDAHHQAANWRSRLLATAAANPAPLWEESVSFKHDPSSAFRRFQPAYRGTADSTASSAYVPHLDISSAGNEPSSSGLVHPSSSAMPMPEIPEHLPPSSLDQFIGDFLVDADDPSLSKLPREVEYMDDPWFDTAYIQFSEFSRKNRGWKYEIKETMSESLKRNILANTRKVFPAKGDVYKVQIEAKYGDDLVPGEVLARYFREGFFKDNIQIKSSTLIVWRTRNKGTSLALVGLYHCPVVVFKKMVELPETETWSVSQSRESDITMVRKVSTTKPDTGSRDFPSGAL